MSFDEQVMQAIRAKILKEIGSTAITSLDYHQRKQLPDDVINKIWNDVDWGAVIAMVKPEMERRICNAIVGNMEKEIKTDVKSILSIDGVRQRIRVEAYPLIMNIVKEESV